VKPKLLVVPHLCAENITIREIELARRLVEFFDVYSPKWSDALHIDGGPPYQRRWRQFRTALQSLLTRSHHSRGADGITYLAVPVLQPMLLRRAVGGRLALSLSELFNRRVLDKIISSLGIRCVLLAADSFGLPRTPGVRVFFDLVDWFPEEKSSPRHLAFVRRRLRKIAGRVQGLFAVSEPLCQKLKAELGIDAIPLPNGADLEALRSVDPEEVATVRSQWRLQGKFVIGYVGNHGSFTGVDFVVKVFQAVCQRIPNAALLIVGPADYWSPILSAVRSQGVTCTGPIAPSKIAPYFNAIDLGVLAQEKSLGTEFAFQIKNVEYTACRKFVVSTPLRTWERLRWPNIFLAERDVETWVSAICKARDATWLPEWDRLTEPYDWKVLAGNLARILVGSELVETES